MFDSGVILLWEIICKSPLGGQSVKELWRILLKSIIDSQLLLYLLQVVLNVWTFVGTKNCYVKEI